MRYHLLCSSNPEVLEDQVNKALECGWIPQGGVSSVTVADQEGVIVMAYAQAIICPDD